MEATSTLTQMPWMEFADAYCPRAFEQCATHHMKDKEQTWHTSINIRNPAGHVDSPQLSLLHGPLGLLEQVSRFKEQCRMFQR